MAKVDFSFNLGRYKNGDICALFCIFRGEIKYIIIC